MVIFNKRFRLQSLIDFGGRNIYHDDHEKTDYNRICSNHMDNTMRRFIIKMGTILISFLAFAIGPINAFVVYGIRTTVVEGRIPFTESKSNAEFKVNVLLQSIMTVHGSLCYIALELFQSILENVVTITPRLIKGELVQTIELYEKKSIAELELNMKIGNIVKQSIDADK